MEKNEKRGWAVVAIFLLIGLLCVFVAGNMAIRFAPNWSLNADMRSRLDADSAYLTSMPLERDIVFQPVDPSILTPPGWIKVFLTPGATYPTRVPKATATSTQIAAPTQQPTQVPPTVTPSATPTLVWLYFTPTQSSGPASTATAKPPIASATATVKPPIVSATATLMPSTTPSNPSLPLLADLQITVNNGVDFYSAGGTLTYTVIVSNMGPGSINAAAVTDNIPVQLSNWNWICTSQSGGATGCQNMNGKMNFSNTLNLPANSNITYNVSANISGNATGSLTNMASVSLPAAAMDPNMANNTASDTDNPGVDLQITIDDGVTSYSPGGTLNYTMVAINNSAFTVNGAVVTDTFPAVISGASWNCVPDAGASCTPNGTGNINDSVLLPPGQKVTYQITAPVSSYAVGTLTNSASITAPAGFVETVPGNNQAQDTDACTSSEPDVGPPNGDWLPIPPNSSITLELSQPIIANGDSGVPDFVYYERRASPTANNIEMDWVQVEISADGNTWYQVLYWGDPPGLPDVNTNIDVQHIIGDICPTEYDNCPIPFDRLYNNTGITIDVDGYAPPGSYPWIRLSSPPSVDDAEVDAIQPYYP